MTDPTKTIVAAVIAAALCAGAYLTAPHRVVSATFSDQGKPFYPDFKDPLAAKSLEVIGYDEGTASLLPFKVQFDGKKWVIPSHHNYPADAEKNMASAASGFIGLTKDAVVTDNPSDYPALGVVAPDDDKAPLTGRGTRVTIKDAGGGVLSDLIIGKPVEKSQVGGLVYARVPGKSRVYAVHFTGKVTTRFADWVQTDVLKAASANFTSIVEDKYKVDEVQGLQIPGEKITITKAPPAPAPPPASNPDQPPPAAPRWAFTAEPGGGPTPGEKVNDTRVDEIVNTLHSLRIDGVRPKPAKLVTYFENNAKTGLSRLDLFSLQSVGFFAAPDGRFVGDEGEMIADCDDGVSYHLYFGNVLVAQGEELSAGLNDDSGAPAAKPAGAPTDKAPAPKDSKDAKPKGIESRFMFATATFDESLLGPAPVPPTAPTAPAGYTEPKPGEAPAAAATTPAPADAPKPDAAKPDASAAAPAADSPEITAYKAAKDAYTKALGEYNQKVAARTSIMDAGKKRAEQLRKNFAGWYYLIDAESFAKLRPTRADLIVKPPAAPTLPTAPGAIPAPTPGENPVVPPIQQVTPPPAAQPAPTEPETSQPAPNP